jgi:DNA-binding LacI/PurR family transcriptional regulator
LSETLAGKTITARDLAKLLGVSQSAVSRAFTPGASISPSMRERILDGATRFGYQPNAIASILSRKRSDIVGLVVSELRNPFYPQLIEKLTRGLQEQGLQTLLFNVTPGSDVRQQMQALRQYHVDALVILSATVLSGVGLNWIAEGRRAVLVNRVAPDAALTCVSTDNVAAARAVADHFYALGRRRVAYVGGLGGTSTGLERQSGFITRVAECGMTLAARHIAGDYSYEGGHRCAQAIMRDGGADAIFFANDMLAMGGMDALRDAFGLRVPEDVAIAGFDDIDMARWPRYSLTTCRQPLDALVKATLQAIAQTPDDGERVQLVDVELVVRRSTDPAAPTG